MTDFEASGLELAALRTELAAVRESERNYRRIIETSHDVIWAVDKAGQITFVNRATREVYGCEPEAMIGRTFSELICAEDRERAQAEFVRAILSGEDTLNMETGVCHEDGRRVILATNARILRDDDGCVIGSIGVSRDITVVKEADRKLHLERERLAEAQSLAKVGSWEIDLRANTLTWSDENHRIYEVEKCGRRLSYETFIDRVHPDDRAEVNREFAAAIARHSRYALDHRLRMPDGRVKYIHSRCETYYGDNGTPVRSMGTTQDVTDRKLVEAALDDSRQALVAVLDNVPQRVFWKDLDSVYVGCNRRFASDMGLDDPADVIGKTDDDAPWKAHAARCRSHDRDVIVSGRPQLDYEEPTTLAGGQASWVRTSKVPLRGRDGKVTGLLGTFEDITERKGLEQQLLHAQRLESIGTLAAGMAHEINNPLTYILGNVGLCREGLGAAHGQLVQLRDGTSSPGALDAVIQRLAEMEEPLREASDGAERVRRLVIDVKNTASPNDGSRATHDLVPMIETAVKMTANALRHSAVVRTSLAATPLVEASDGPFVQVITNLLINAAHAIGDGRANANEIRVTAYTDATGWACVEIKDTGPGIAADVLPRIFDPFFTTKRLGGGMGLGLTTSHSIIAGLGGRLTAESPPDGGALFRVSLPPAKADETAPPALLRGPAATTATSTRRNRILVIDDERSVAVTIRRMLSTQHDVTMMTDGRAAIAAIAAGEAYDLIFCDLMMPNLSGIEVYQSIAAISSAQASKIVIMTGGAFTGAAQDFLDENGGVHITKPFSVETIRSLAANSRT